MNTYYSVIFASVNPIISEKLSVGLVLSGDNTVQFRYSKDKLSLMHHFFSEEGYRLIKTSLRNIETITASSSPVLGTDRNDILFRQADQAKPFSFEYLSYLSRYSNSTITFSEPVKIDLEATEALFDHLYKEFVFEDEVVIPKYINIESVKSNLYPQIKEHVNWECRIETGKLAGLIMPVELDFIGKNHQPVVGKITNFDQPAYHLDASLSSLFVLMKAFEMNKETGKYFLIGNEPEKKNQKQHKTWEAIRAANLMNFVPFDETEQITEYMETHAVEPYFQ